MDDRRKEIIALGGGTRQKLKRLRDADEQAVSMVQSVLAAWGVPQVFRGRKTVFRIVGRRPYPPSNKKRKEIVRSDYFWDHLGL